MDLNFNYHFAYCLGHLHIYYTICIGSRVSRIHICSKWCAGDCWRQIQDEILVKILTNALMMSDALEIG